MEDKDVAIQSKDLKWFLIKRFLLIMLFIFISEELLNMIYRLWLAPFLENTLHIRQMSVTAKGGSVMLFALQMLLLTAATFLPEVISGQVQTWIGKSMGSLVRVDIASPVLEGITNPKLIQLYHVTVIFIFMGLLVVTLIPYVVSAYWYYRAVSRKVNELIIAEKKQKEAYDKQRNLLLSDISHDIKTPITTICGYAGALTDGMVSDEGKKEEYLRAIYAKSMRVDELINLLLEYVQLDSSGFTLHREKADLGELLRENIALLYSDFEEKDVTIDIDIPEREFPYEIDKVQMGRAVINILSNAVKYNDRGTKISVSLSEDEAYLIRIADDGVQIDEALAEHIFEPFSRGDKARNTKGGSGLGLSISHKIVQMHGGELKLEQECRDGYVKAFVIALGK